MEAYRTENYVLVSAGHAMAHNFLNKTRAIMELSDVIVRNSMGTHVGYASYLGKP